MKLEFAIFVLSVVAHFLGFLIKFSAMIYLFTIVKGIHKTYKWPFNAMSVFDRTVGGWRLGWYLSSNLHCCFVFFTINYLH